MTPKARRKWMVFLKAAAHVLLIPMALLEHWGLFWFWAGDGLFMLIGVPVFYALFQAVHGILLAKFHRKGWPLWLLICSMVFVVPLLTIGACYGAAWLVGYEIVIM